jgi:hypothetical protein
VTNALSASWTSSALTASHPGAPIDLLLTDRCQQDQRTLPDAAGVSHQDLIVPISVRLYQRL